MKVSVIVPVYNTSDYLGDCLESIISQDYKDLEIILIDDGSRDNSGEICDKYREADDRIIVIHQDNHGVSSARNRGIEIASGQLIAFVDSDDTIDHKLISTLYNDLTKNHADIAICSYSTFNENSSEFIGNSGKQFAFSSNEALENLISGKFYIGGLCTKLYKADVILNCRLDETIKINEDVLMNYYVFKNAERVIFNDTSLYNYRANRKGATNTIDHIGGRADEYKVAKTIYEDSKEKAYHQAAEKRYCVSMLNYYQSFVMEGQQNDIEAIHLRQKLKDERVIGKLSSRPQRIRCMIFIWFPSLAKIVYRIHEKTRKISHAPVYE